MKPPFTRKEGSSLAGRLNILSTLFSQASYVVPVGDFASADPAVRRKLAQKLFKMSGELEAIGQAINPADDQDNDPLLRDALAAGWGERAEPAKPFQIPSGRAIPAMNTKKKKPARAEDTTSTARTGV